MTYTTQCKVTCELLNDSYLTDDYIYIELVRKMFSEIPIDVLKKIVRFTKTDPNSDDAKRRLHDDSTSDVEKGRLFRLLHEQVVEYKIEIDFECIKSELSDLKPAKKPRK